MAVDMPDSPAARRHALAEMQAQMRACWRCLDIGYDVQGPAVFSGPITARLMIVGQAPARIDSDRDHQPWSGNGGRRLMGWLSQAGFDEERLRRDEYMCALTRCFPGKHPSGKGDRAPSREEQRLCAPYLAGELALIQPQLIVAVGKLAIERFLGPTTLSQTIGRSFLADQRSLERFGAGLPAGTLIVPLPHPSGASLWLNQPANVQLVEAALGHLGELRERLGL